MAVITPAGFSLISSKHFDAHRRAPQLPNGRELSATGTAHSGLNIHKLRLL